MKRVGRCDAYATEFDLEAEEYVPLPKVRCVCVCVECFRGRVCPAIVESVGMNMCVKVPKCGSGWMQSKWCVTLSVACVCVCGVCGVVCGVCV